MPTTPTVAVYCRISKDPSRLEVGVNRQREDCLALANAAFSELEDVCDPTVWDQDIFTPSAYVLEDFERLVHQFDYALLVLGPTDQRISRGRAVQVPRDNVIAELGLFVGAIGRSRVFVLTSDAHGLDLSVMLKL